MIFYDRWMFNQNDGLVEIKDKDFVNKLKLDHD